MSAYPWVWLTFGFFLTATAHGDEPLPANVRKLVEGYREAAVRVNGTRLKLTAVDDQGKPDPAEQGPLCMPLGPYLGLHWEIDYTGPRAPLTLLKPSLAPGGPSSVIVFLIGPDGKDYIVPVHAPPPIILGPWAPQKEAFVTIAGKEMAKGTVSLSWGMVLQRARDRWPETFGKTLPASAYVQLRHLPSDRGEHLNLDAWTGTLQTELIPVPLRKWSRP